jgi:uncharacterized protein with von Willebrand factor type A (vWA) domain
VFVRFFYLLREHGVPVTPTSFLRLQQALAVGQIASLDELYVAARTILVKSELYFDRYDQVFAHLFAGVEMVLCEDEDDLFAHALLEQWLLEPETVAVLLGIDEDALSRMSRAELLAYFKARLEEQQGAHHGGNTWIGTGGTSPTGHSGRYYGGLRIGGRGLNQSALLVARDRRYKDYGIDSPLNSATWSEGLARLRHLVAAGAATRLDVEASVAATVNNGGDIEVVFRRAPVDRLEVVLAIDNGGWSMDPYVELVQALFDQAGSRFKRLTTYYFHNTIYDVVWRDPARRRHPVRIEDMHDHSRDSRLLIVGDAHMAPYELMISEGSIHAGERSGQPSTMRLRLLAARFPRRVWLNPLPAWRWAASPTISHISSLFPMFACTLEGLEAAVSSLNAPPASKMPAEIGI